MQKPSTPDLRTVLDLWIGYRWVALDTREAGEFAGVMNATAVGIYLDTDIRNDTVGHGRDYYALTVSSGEPISMPVSVLIDRVPDSSQWARGQRSIVTGFSNRNPFPAYEAEIAALGQHLGIVLDQDLYPYGQSTALKRDMIGTADVFQVYGMVAKHTGRAWPENVEGAPVGVVAFQRLSPKKDKDVDWTALRADLQDLTGLDVVGIGDVNAHTTGTDTRVVTAIAFDVPGIEEVYTNLRDHRMYTPPTPS